MSGTIITAVPTNALNGDVALKADGTSGVRSDLVALKRWAVGFMVNAAGNVGSIELCLAPRGPGCGVTRASCDA